VALDRDRIRFKGKVISAAIRQGSSLQGEESAPFFEMLYSEWVGSGMTISGADAWLDNRLGGAFESIAQPPMWIEDEPSWPYLSGKPMIFLTQCTIAETELSIRALAAGETVYLFGARETAGGKTRMVYRTVSQFAAGY